HRCSTKVSVSTPWTPWSSWSLSRRSSGSGSRATRSAKRRSPRSAPWQLSSMGTSPRRGNRMPGIDPYPGASRAVVVTGLGTVSPLGWSLESVWDGLRSGRTAIGPFDRFDHSGHRTHIAAQVDLTAEPERPRGKPRRLSIADQFAVAAAREAVAQAAIDVDGWQ